MKKRDLAIVTSLLSFVSSAALAATPVSESVVGDPIAQPQIELRFRTSLGGTVLTNPVRFPTHRGFVILHISERQAQMKSPTPYTLTVAPHCVELARKTTSAEVIITPFDDGVCTLTITDQLGTTATTQVYVGSQAIAQLGATPSPSPTPTETPAPAPSPTGT